VYDVVLLTLGPGRDGPAGCADGGACCGSTPGSGGDGCAETPRVPVLACVDALTARGARVEAITAHSDAEIDAVLARLDGPPRADGLTWPDADGKTRLVVATASNGQLRAVVRRLVRRYAPPPSRRPADLAANRTVPDLPPIAVLPLEPARSAAASTGGPRPTGGRGGTGPDRAGSGPAESGPARTGRAESGPARTGPAESGPPGSGPDDLAGQLGLPRDPAEVAAAVLDGRVRRVDLLRNDGGSVTLDGALLGGADDAGRPLAWRGRVEVDDTVLSEGEEPLLACAIGNAGGYATIEGLSLLSTPDPADGTVDVAVAVPVVAGSRLGKKRVRLEVRRARGRAVAVTPRDGQLPYLDDGVVGELSRKRSWWIEPGAWAVYAG
jgi:hypothetical protein